MYKLRYFQYNERSILVNWPSRIDEFILKDSVKFKNKLESCNIKSLLEINIGYNSLLIIYKDTIENINDTILDLKSIYNSKNSLGKSVKRLWKIPVCYDEEFGTDLETFSIEKNISKTKIIQLHSEAIYTVFFIGFLPGFLYLGGLHSELFLERKNTPNLNVKKGAVGIGNTQTGIYPKDSPGGWHIIGNSPLNFFDITSESPCFAQLGDKVKFVPISTKRYYGISELVKSNLYNLESELIDD